MFFVLVLYTLFASVFVVAKDALAVASPLFLLGSRMTLAGFLMLLFQWFRNASFLSLTKTQLTQILLLGVCNIYLTNSLELWGLQYLTSFKTCFLYSLSPFLTAFFSYLIFQETLNPKKWIGVFIGLIGFTPTLLSPSTQESIAGQFCSFSLAELAVFGAVTFSVLGWVTLKNLMSCSNCSAVVANGYSMLFGGSIALVHSLFSENWNPIPVTDMSRWIGCSLLLICISNFICYNLYGWLLKRFSSTFMSFAGLSTPLFTALFGWAYFDECPQWDFYVSLLFVTLGLIVFYLEELKEIQLFTGKGESHSVTGEEH